MENIVYSRLQRNFIGGLISGIGSVFGGAINAYSQKQQNERNIQAQAEENQKNRDFTEEMYNKYESPAAQRQQMLEAGLNPMGAISPQSVGSASTSALPAGEAPQFGSAIQQGIQSFFDAGTAIRAQRLQDQEIEQAKLDNWKKAFENGNAQALFDSQLAEIESRTALNRQQKRAKAQEIKALKLSYKKAQEAYEVGINEYVDVHNESVGRTDNLGADTAKKKAETTSISDVNKRANELHDYAKKLAQADLNAKDFTNAMLADQAVFTMDKSNMRDYLNVNYDDLPQWLKPYALVLYNTNKLLKSADPSSSSYKEVEKFLDEAKSEFNQLNAKFTSDSSFNNSVRDVSSFTTALSYLSTVSSEEAKWARESHQRMYDNIMKGIDAASKLSD